MEAGVQKPIESCGESRRQLDGMASFIFSRSRWQRNKNRASISLSNWRRYAESTAMCCRRANGSSVASASWSCFSMAMFLREWMLDDDERANDAPQVWSNGAHHARVLRLARRNLLVWRDDFPGRLLRFTSWGVVIYVIKPYRLELSDVPLNR